MINRSFSSLFIRCQPRLVIARSFHHHRAPDYYAILGVSKHVQINEIKFAYFNMAKKFHPDTNKTLDAKQMFALVAEAYDVLSDDDRRAKYDETGLSEERFGGTSKGPGRQSTDSTYTAEQMYQTIFGSSAKEGEQDEHAHEDFAETHAGTESTREYIVQVSTKEAVVGVKVGVQLRISGTCDKCFGDQSEMGYTGNVCPYCEGTGQETIRSGHMTARKTCSYCNGTKIFIKFKCHECSGLGRKMYDVYYPINVPAGSQHGEVFRVEVNPEFFAEIIPGRRDEQMQTLFITVDVLKDEDFSLDGRDIISNLELSPAMAFLGGKMPFRSLARDLVIDIKPGTSSHSAIVKAEEGVRTSCSLPGDLVLNTTIRVPTKLSWRQHRIWRKFAHLEPSQAGGLVDGVATDSDHRLGVNIVVADRIYNSVVKVKKIKGMDETILDTIRTKMGKPKPGEDERPREFQKIRSLWDI